MLVRWTRSNAVLTSISNESSSPPAGCPRVATAHPNRRSSSMVGREARQSQGRHLQPRHSVPVTHRWWRAHPHKSSVSTVNPQFGWFRWTLPVLHQQQNSEQVAHMLIFFPNGTRTATTSIWKHRTEGHPRDVKSGCVLFPAPLHPVLSSQTYQAPS